MPLLLPLVEPVEPDPALGLELLELELLGLVLVSEPELELVEFGLVASRSVLELLELLGGFALTSALLEDDGAVLDPEDAFPGIVDDEEDELGAVEGTGVVAPGRAEDPVVAFLLSPQALIATVTAATTASFAKVRKVLSIYTLLLRD